VFTNAFETEALAHCDTREIVGVRYVEDFSTSR
jgi:hypothetical protein